ncbi:glycoside hydrolase family 15 protein [Robbsia andropogonis]|uniref:glycoside hydrolase family 15 protein n=1 Tax=Robbsia andropogonis TaxID=28092 RepID=UPI00209DE2B8|nr:glycoside hydrolase family 15 protein [Robbsia andropogonis]MCP1118977.1 glycoside hydrolase family 15 protein [Robbsia andropogonis]MCP1128671.1 glycoside hydrolase family 15 protein [Robbsia andropogonis]
MADTNQPRGASTQKGPAARDGATDNHSASDASFGTPDDTPRGPANITPVSAAIGDHGVVGNMRTLALVSTAAHIDFLCYPAFDSPTVFASLLDAERGGHFAIAPRLQRPRVRQMYLPETNVLLTRFMSEEGVVEIVDFMPLHTGRNDGNHAPGTSVPQEGHAAPQCTEANQLIRIVSIIRGTIGFDLLCAPRFNYARTPHETTQDAHGDVLFTPCYDDAPPQDVAAASDGVGAPAQDRIRQPPLRLSASVPLSIANGDACAHFALSEGTRVAFVFGADDDGLGQGATGDIARAIHSPEADINASLAMPSPSRAPACGKASSHEEGEGRRSPANDEQGMMSPGRQTLAAIVPCLHATIAGWRAWSDRATYRGRYREMVTRSALLLKLLSSRDHGAIIAAGTFGLPETTEGHRRWDYRYTWIRDAAFSIYALIRLGHADEADAFVRWMNRRVDHPDFDGRLKVVYGLAGDCPSEEVALASLADGHAQQPPLIGNAAADQLQLDIYGALMDALYLDNKYGTPISHDGWRNVTKMIEYVVEHWREPDAGIWEFRPGNQPLLHSRLMCWVAVDRALRLAAKRSLPAPVERWTAVRGDIYDDIFTHFWNPDLKAFVQSRGGNRLDAAALMMPLVKFISPKDPRWLSTLDAIGRELVVDPLVYRYPPDGGDGLDGSEGSFLACSFWYAEALARAGRVDEGRLIFEKTLGYANHLGLYSEELSAAGEPLGNFPQCLPHLALISAAYELDRNL